MSGDLTVSNRLFVTNDVSLNNKLFVIGDVSLNNDLFVGLDASFSGKLFVNGDVSMNNDLFVGSDASFGGKLFTVGDVSLNSRLFLGSDASINGLTLGKGGGNISTNTVFGYQALTSNTTGTTNTAIGYQAGTAGTANTTGSNNTYIGYQAQANANNYTKSTALGSGATITASNQVVLGTTSETVKYNKLAPLYTSVPTYTSSDVGYIYSSSVGQTLYSSGTADFITISNLAVGVYIVKIDMLVFDPGAVGVEKYINIEIRKSGTTLTYASKAFGGLSTTSWVNSPLSLSAFLTSSGTDSITVNRSSNISYNAYWYFQYIRIA
jgi:hypothetical protein